MSLELHPPLGASWLCPCRSRRGRSLRSVGKPKFERRSSQRDVQLDTLSIRGGGLPDRADPLVRARRHGAARLQASCTRRIRRCATSSSTRWSPSTGCSLRAARAGRRGATSAPHIGGSTGLPDPTRAWASWALAWRENYTFGSIETSAGNSRLSRKIHEFTASVLAVWAKFRPSRASRLQSVHQSEPSLLVVDVAAMTTALRGGLGQDQEGRERPSQTCPVY